MHIVDLGTIFRQATSIVYPPFKQGRYLEEYAYEYFTQHAADIDTPLVYLAAFWTNLQIHPDYENRRANYQLLLDKALQAFTPDTRFFTIVQHDDGVTLRLPPNTLLFGGCTGDIPIPLIYEDTSHRLQQAAKTLPLPPLDGPLASFVGSDTHYVRRAMMDVLRGRPKIEAGLQQWTNQLSDDAMEHFIHSTLAATFCLAPRGYGRSSFRFFEALQLGRVPVYFWDDGEWLPYKDELDYREFAISIPMKDIERTYEILKAVTDLQYEVMQRRGSAVAHYFTLEGMCEYITRLLEKVSKTPLSAVGVTSLQTLPSSA